MPRLADVYHLRLQQLADRAGQRLTEAWLWSATQTSQEAAWLTAARPVLAGASQAAVATSAAYATRHSGTAALNPSALIVPDAVAHVWDPLTVLGSNLAEGTVWADAAAAAAPSASALGVSTVMSSGRQALAEQYPVRTRFQRQVNAGACDWCLGLSGVVWESAEAGSFGHDECKCVNLPIGQADNRQVLEAARWDGTATQYRARRQVAQLRKSEQTAIRRSREAKAAQRTETDPDRLERLSMREQDWETRAERAAERRRILETGTHRLAA